MDWINLTPFLDWIGAHPGWAGLAVFLIAFSESLAVVGLFMPGAALMFGVGAIVGAGRLELWSTLVWAAAGAFAGDALSYWLGRHFHQQLKVMWPFSRYPQLIARATDFFHRHGGKSILFGRFVGPIRPVIPAVAGMLDMPATRFVPVNLVSALLWAPAYLLPGMVFAASLGVAAEVATHLAVLVVLLVALLLAVVWLSRRLFDLLHPRAHALIIRMLEWSQRHPLAGKLPAAVLDPGHPEARGLTLLALLLLGAGGGFLWLLQRSLGGDGLGDLDHYLARSLMAMRTPWIDSLMVAVTQLGDPLVLSVLFAVVLSWLLGHRYRQAAAHWAAAAVFALLLPPLVQLALGSAPRFPSGHTTQALVIYGFLAAMLGREMGDNARRLLYSLTGLLVVMIATSRLYLGAHRLSDMLGGLTLGLAWVALLGIAYRRHPAPRLPLLKSGALIFMTLLLAGGTNAILHYQSDRRLYAIQPHYIAMPMAQWWTSGWREMDTYRDTLVAGRGQPLNLQYAGALPPLIRQLEARGWYSPPTLTASSWLRWLAGHVPLKSLPVLPQVHDGRHQALILVHGERTGERLLTLRLWHSRVRLQPGGTPLWIGNVTELYASHPFWGLSVPRTGDDFDRPLQRLAEDMTGLSRQQVNRQGIKRWDGAVLLLRAPATGRESAPAGDATAREDRPAAAGPASR